MSPQQKRRNSYLLRRFGITLKQYDEILRKQGGGCAVCDAPPKPERAHAVDHDHKTGEIFGILCYRCNHRLIGRIRDGNLFTAAGLYLRKGTGLFVPAKKKKCKRKKRR